MTDRQIAAGLPAVPSDSNPRRRASPPLYVFAFLLFLSLWTWKLLEPNPVPETIRGGLTADLAYVLAKCLHLGGYAFLTVLGSLAFPRRKWWVVGFMMLHGVGSEIGQTYVPNRHGCVLDVLIDWFGIGCGVAAWRAARRKPAG